MKPEIAPGYVVFSKKGRDKGRYFVVLYMVDADFALIADGDIRKLDRLKKKRLKHLQACPVEAPELLEMAKRGTLKDSDIRKVLFPIKQGTAGASASEKNREG